MIEINNPYIQLKEHLDKKDCENINRLCKLCLAYDKTSLKLELEYKRKRAEGKTGPLNHSNEFMYYGNGILIGYIGICDFGGDTVEVNGMVHPDYRREGVFKKLFQHVKDEWNKSDARTMLLLCDQQSISGIQFIKYTKARYKNSEYEMYLQRNAQQKSTYDSVVLRKATNEDAKEIALQNSMYFDDEFQEEDFTMPEEEEKCGLTIYMAELKNKVIGKVHLEYTDDLGGIYGLGVLEEHRGKGYGREILTKAVVKLKEKNPQDIMLQVATNNEKALTLYTSCGFYKTSTMDYYEISK